MDDDLFNREFSLDRVSVIHRRVVGRPLYNVNAVLYFGNIYFQSLLCICMSKCGVPSFRGDYR